MSDIKNLQQKFAVAIEGFAVSEEPLSVRLLRAFSGTLDCLREADFPSDLLAKWKPVCAEMVSRGPYDVTARQMAPEKARELITEIVAIGEELLKRRDDHRGPHRSRRFPVN